MRIFVHEKVKNKTNITTLVLKTTLNYDKKQKHPMLGDGNRTNHWG